MNKRALGFVLLLILTSSLPTPARQGPANGRREQAAGPAWSELEQAMGKMHAEMGTIRPSGDDDVDFVRIMLPHHQAAIDMARTQLVYGKDPQIRRLAQEIITDQQSEIELMRLWLKQSEHGSRK